MALKIIGSQLRENGMDLDKWERQSLELKNMVDEYKEDVVKKMVKESFEKLFSEKQRLVFLDVALFVVPYYHSHGIEYKAAVELLSLMHECNPDTIERQIKKLIRLCFLQLNGERIAVHDLFMEFAKGVSDASSVYYCRRSNIGGVQVKLDLCRIAGKPNAALRALILEVDEKCERFEFSTGLSGVIVIVVRNCKSLAALELAGLTSLVSLEIEECPSLSSVGFDPAHTCTLKSVKWVTWSACECKFDQQSQGSFLQSLLQMSRVGNGYMQARRLISKGWCSMLALSGRPQRPLHGAMSLASQLKALEVLRLHGTGITSLGDLSSYWPQLRVLEVLEDRLEDLELGNLPNLKQFFLGDAVGTYDFVNYSTNISPKRAEIRMPKKPTLLAGCPQLEDVRICLPSCEDGMGSLVIPSRNLQRLWLKQIHHGGPVLLDFTSSAHSLQEINVQDHRVVQSIEFTHQFLKLERLQLQSCSSLVKITGLECLPNLRSLIVRKCSELQGLGNLGAVRMLEQLNLVDCPLLILTSRGLSNLEFLEKISVSNCSHVQILHGDLENLTALKFIECTVSGNMLKLEKLEKLENLALGQKIGEEQAATQLYLCYSMNGEANCEHGNDNAQLQSSLKCVPLLVVRESAPAHLSSLRLDRVEDLVCLDGIDCLVTLQDLWLMHLPKLASLQGLQSLTHLMLLHIEHCVAITELPSLCTLVKMESLYIGQCANLTALEGCDKLRSLNYADFHGCENLEPCPFPAEQLLQPGFLQNGEPSFTDCKFASMKAMVGWLLDEEVSLAVWDASLYALEWELHDRFCEKPRERMQVGEQLVEAVAAHLTRKLLALTLDTCFDFEPWVDDLKAAWRYAWKVRARSSYPRGLERVLRSLGGVPCRRLLEQCTSDAPFCTSIASCLLDTHPRVLHDWIERIREDVE